METSALTRLTEREKDCLRRWLNHRTAKEIALDLGISPHAVEKRLKMARAKLGVSSSLEAARLVAKAEGYQRPGPHPPDLADQAREDHLRPSRFWLAGGLAMSFVILASAALVLSSQGAAPATPRGNREHWTTAQQIEQVVTQNFANMDRDRSGFVEPREVAAATDAARKEFVASVDKNGDGKFDLAEYRAWLMPILARQGAAGPNGRPITYETFQPSELVEPTPAEIALSIQDTFSMMDTDRSGFIEANETLRHEIELSADKTVLERPMFRRNAEGRAQPMGKVLRISVAEAQAQEIAQADTNKDGRLDFVEYRKWMTPILQKHGFPKAWRADIERTYARAN